MKLSRHKVREIMVEAIKAEGHNFKISKDGVEFVTLMTEQFVSNLSKNSIAGVQSEGMRTIMRHHLSQTLDSVSLALKNLPKIGVNGVNEGVDNRNERCSSDE